MKPSQTAALCRALALDRIAEPLSTDARRVSVDAILKDDRRGRQESLFIRTAVVRRNAGRRQAALISLSPGDLMLVHIRGILLSMLENIFIRNEICFVCQARGQTESMLFMSTHCKDGRRALAVRPGRFLRRLAADRRGAASVEFLLIAPVLLLLFVGIVDIGNVLFTRFRLNAAVAAGMNYGIVHSSEVVGTNAAVLAAAAARLVAGASQTDSVTATVVVNNGPTATVTGNGTPSISGAASTNNNRCYCPTPGNDWSVSANCTSNCSGSVIAGRFIRVTASKPYAALFSSYGIVQNGTITASNIVQTE